MATANGMLNSIYLPVAVRQYIEENEINEAIGKAMNETIARAPPEDPFGDLILNLSQRLAGGEPKFGRLRMQEHSRVPNKRVCDVIMNVRGAPVKIHRFSMTIRKPGESTDDAGGGGDGDSPDAEGLEEVLNTPSFVPTPDQLRQFCDLVFQSGNTLSQIQAHFDSRVLEQLFSSVGSSSSGAPFGEMAALQANVGRMETNVFRRKLSKKDLLIMAKRYKEFSLQIQGNLLVSEAKINNCTSFEFLSGFSKNLEEATPLFFCCRIWVLKPDLEGGTDTVNETGVIPCSDAFIGVALPWTTKLQSREAPMLNGDRPTAFPINAYERMSEITTKMNEEVVTKIGEVIMSHEASGLLYTTSPRDTFLVLREMAEALLLPAADLPVENRLQGIIPPEPGVTFYPVFCAKTPQVRYGNVFGDGLLEENKDLLIFADPACYDEIDTERHQQIQESHTTPVTFDSPVGYLARHVHSATPLFVDYTDPELLDTEFPFFDVFLASNCVIPEEKYRVTRHVVNLAFTEGLVARTKALYSSVGEEVLPGEDIPAIRREEEPLLEEEG